MLILVAEPGMAPSFCSKQVVGALTGTKCFWLTARYPSATKAAAPSGFRAQGLKDEDPLAFLQGVADRRGSYYDGGQHLNNLLLNRVPWWWAPRLICPLTPRPL